MVMNRKKWRYGVIVMIDATILQAQNLAASGRMAEAGRVLERAAEEFPDSVEILSHLGYYYFKIGRYTHAIDAFNRRRRLAEPDLGVCQIMAAIYTARNEPCEQRYWLRQAANSGDRSLNLRVRIFYTYFQEILRCFICANQRIPSFLLPMLECYKRFCFYVCNVLIRILRLEKNESHFRLRDYLRFYQRYDPSYPREMFAYHKNREAQIVSSHLPIHDGDAKILDIGTGKNTLPLFWASYGPQIISLDGSLYGFDHLERAKSGLKKDGAPARIEFVAGDGLRLPFPADTFDGVSAICAIEHIPGDGDIECMKEIHRVTKSGGIAVVTVETNRHCCESWMEAPYERGFQVGDDINKNDEKQETRWHEVFCRNYAPAAMLERLARSADWSGIEYGFYDERLLPIRQWLDHVRHPILARVFRPFQPLLALLNYRKQENLKKLTPSSIGYLILQKM
jgi:ubiquinone/menaquinone biosynthesis C-methylase UbiE